MNNNEKALMLHEEWKGKINTTSKCDINTREDLALAYTPGVAEPCKVIAQNPEKAYTYTINGNVRTKRREQKNAPESPPDGSVPAADKTHMHI